MDGSPANDAFIDRDPYERPSFTMGIEEEYMLIDPETRELKSHLQVELLSKGRAILEEIVKPEMHGSMLEIGTPVCQNADQLHGELQKIRSVVNHLAKSNGLKLGASSTHPFTHWSTQEIYPDERYHAMLEDMQLLARSLLIFGMHIHIGIENRETQIKIMNEMRYFLPHILALTVSSPFWTGINTGLKSYRSKIFERFPRTNIPEAFSSWRDYDSYTKLLVKTHSIDNPKRIWWDIRPHPTFPTLEIRICDLPMSYEDSVAIAALVQAIAAKLFLLYRRNLSFRIYSRSLVMENKWRAVRYGLEGKMIDFGKQKEVPARELVRELLFFIDDVVDDLGSREHINRIYDILDNGTAAQRQIKVWEENDEDPVAVVDFIIEETEKGLLSDPKDFMPSVTEAPEDLIKERNSSKLKGDGTIL